MQRKIVLGIHIGHDRGVALIINGKLVCHLAQERIDRIKHSNSPEIPYDSLFKLLEYNSLSVDDIDAIGISYTKVVISQILSQLSSELTERLGLTNIPIIGVSHHDAHAYSTYYTSDFKDCMILVADGAGDIVGEKIEAESLYTAKEGEIKLIDQRLQDSGLWRNDRRNSFYPDYFHIIDRKKEVSIGRKYEQLTCLIGFKHTEAGKTMGLASYGKPLFKLSKKTFNNLNFSLTFEDYLQQVDETRIKRNLSWFQFLQQYRIEIASLAQEIIEQHILGILQIANKNGQFQNLCLAGGLFLNCSLNHKILQKTKFKKIHIIPAAGDDGQSIGAAFYAYRKVFGSINPSSSSLPYLGISYSNSEIEERLNYYKLTYQKLTDNKLISILAKELSAGKLIGLIRGRSESGPRALCHRSILADPRPELHKEKINLLKGRELFRPFAPVVTKEDQFKFFNHLQDSPYMLLAAKTNLKYRKKLAAINHVDNTARVQAVSKKSEPFIYRLLKNVQEHTGFPVILNTSFNLAGEPLVESPNDAILSFLTSSLDFLVIENYIISK